jgi:flagellar hook-length control protein FliK
MNTGLLTNTLVGNVGAVLTPSKPAAARNTSRFAPNPPDNPYPAKAQEATTDNTLNIAQNEHIDRPPQEFRYTLRKKTMTEGHQEGQVGTESKGQSPTSDKAEQPGIVQSWLAQHPLVEHGKKGVARKMGPRAGYELAQLLAGLRTDKFPPGTGPTAKPVAKEPLITIDKGRLGLKAVLPDSAGNTLVTGTQPAERKNAGKIQISTKTLINAKGLINQQSGKELDSEALIADSKTTTIGEKPTIAGTSTASGTQKTPVLSGKKLTPETLAADSKTAIVGEKTAITNEQAISGGQKIPVLGGKKLTPETLAVDSKTAIVGEKTAITDEQAISGGQKTPVLSGKKLTPETIAAGSKTAITDGQAIAGGQKTPLLNDSFQAVQDKSTAARQKVPVDPEKSALIAEKPTGNKADTTQRSHPDAPGLSGLTDGSGREQADNPSGKLLLQNLNPAQVQVSTGQTKGPSSSTSGKNSNSNFEQILSNNAQTPITEQTSASAQTAKAAGNASPGNAFANVSEQLQESIHTSLRQGDQQLTIQLNPPELGRVFIKFQEQGNQITGLLEVDKAQTRYEIQQALPQIIRNLAECGVQIKRLEVVLTNQQEQHAFKDPSLAAEQDDWSGQQAGAEGNNPNPDTFGNDEWLTDDLNYSGYSGPQEMLIADDFVDVLV